MYKCSYSLHNFVLIACLSVAQWSHTISGYLFLSLTVSKDVWWRKTHFQLHSKSTFKHVSQQMYMCALVHCQWEVKEIIDSRGESWRRPSTSNLMAKLRGVEYLPERTVIQDCCWIMFFLANQWKEAVFTIYILGFNKLFFPFEGKLKKQKWRQTAMIVYLWLLTGCAGAGPHNSVKPTQCAIPKNPKNRTQ